MQNRTNHPLLLVPGACALALLAAPAAAQTYGLGLLGASGITDDDLLGGAVDIHGSTAIAGAVGFVGSGIPGSGGAWIYQRQSDGLWGESQLLFAPDGAPGDLFGTSVSLMPDRAIVGAPGHDALGSGSGAAYVFERQPDDSWLFTAKLLASDGSASHDFGTSVSIDNNYAVVGAPDGLTGASSAGAAYVFERQLDGTWIEVAKLAQLDPGTNDEFGWSVSIDDERCVVGAPQEDPSGPNSGSAYVFEQQPDGTWPQVAKISASDGDAIDSFGYSVSIGDDLIVSGAWLDEDGDGAGTGSAYVYERQADGTWPQTQKIQSSTGESGDHFGMSVSTDGDGILIGAIHDTVGTKVSAGSAYLFGKDGGGVWIQLDQIFHVGPETNDNFGHAVAIHNGRTIIGASNDDYITDNGGSVSLSYSFGIDQTPPSFHGVGTPGCSGDILIDMNLPPEIGMAGFGLISEPVEPLSVGFLGIGTAADLGGSDPLGLGITMHVDILASSVLLLLPATADADGIGFGAAPIPADPALVGTELHAQSVWPWTSCALGGFNLSASNLISFTILAD